jgi:galactitol-specific phosphotransferase system IIB component
MHIIIMSAKQNDRMEDKPARLTVLIDADKKKAFDDLCAAHDITASQVVRQLIREYLQKHGVQWSRALQSDTD